MGVKILIQQSLFVNIKTLRGCATRGDEYIATLSARVESVRKRTLWGIEYEEKALNDEKGMVIGMKKRLIAAC